MASASTSLLTAEEFWHVVQRPENHGRRLELVRGELIEMSRPGRLHGFVCCNVGMLLMLYARQRKKGYVCSNDTGFIVEREPDTVRGPDLMFFDDAKSMEEIDVKWAGSPPLLTVEVLSPNDNLADVQQRIAEQLAAGVQIVWLVDPSVRTVTVYRATQPPVVLSENDDITGDDVLPDFACKVADFFKLPGE